MTQLPVAAALEMYNRVVEVKSCNTLFMLLLVRASVGGPSILCELTPNYHLTNLVRSLNKQLPTALMVMII